jgi:NADPH2:quinone reductase
MKALLSISRGGPETLSFDEVPPPLPEPNQILLDVKAVGVNYPDVLIIEDRYQFRPTRPFAPGAEVAGIVRQVGSAVSGISVGDHVIALCGWGGMAERVAVDAAKATVIPRDMAFDKAASLLFTYGTALYALEQRAALSAGETLLILGASGGVGLAALDLGKLKGARVVAGVSSQEKLDVVMRRGAHACVVYPRNALEPSAQKALAERFKTACNGAADVVFDNVGGDYAEPALRSTAWSGRYLIVGFTAGVPKIPLNLPLLKGCQLVGVFWGEWMAREREAARRASRRLVDMLRAGQIDPLISRSLPLAAGASAIRELGERSSIGKIVLTV